MKVLEWDFEFLFSIMYNLLILEGVLVGGGILDTPGGGLIVFFYYNWPLLESDFDFKQ